MGNETPMPANQQAFLDRFVAACQTDPRVLAAFLGGSYARGSAAHFSDLDLTIIVTDPAHAGFVAERAAFLEPLGDLIFLESFRYESLVFFIYADGTEGELWFASPSRLDQLQCGVYQPLIDKQGMLVGAQFPEPTPTEAEQTEELRWHLACFWHDMSHFITAMVRGQLWWGYGQLEELRRYCMNLARLREDFLAGMEGHEKVDLALPPSALAPLVVTCCPLERGAMLRAGRALVQYYQEIAHPLAAAHGVPYPMKLERVMLERMEHITV